MEYPCLFLTFFFFFKLKFGKQNKPTKYKFSVPKGHDKNKAENLRVDRPKKIPFVFPVCFKHLSNICFKYKYTLT